MGYYSGDYAKLDEDAIGLRADYGFFEYEIDVFELARYLGISLVPYAEQEQCEPWFYGVFSVNTLLCLRLIRLY